MKLAIQNTNISQSLTLCWSAVVARGGEGTALEVYEELATRGRHTLSVETIDRELARLRAKGCLP